jgi:hypothetical protein
MNINFSHSSEAVRKQLNYEVRLHQFSENEENELCWTPEAGLQANVILPELYAQSFGSANNVAQLHNML